MPPSPFQSPLTHPDNLAANRQGQLAPRQQATAIKWEGPIVGGVLALGLGCLSLGLLFNRGSDVSFLLLMFLVFGGLSVLFGFKPFIAFLLTVRDMQAGEVAMGDGQVAWVRNAYRVRGLERPGWSGDAAQLPPGHYRFYYLPTSGQLVGAEALGGQSLGGAAEVQNILGSVLKFSPEDLQANRQNQLSPTQTARLRNSAIIYAALAGLGGVVGLGLILFGLFERSLGIFGTLSLVVLFFAAVFGWLAFPRWQDFSGGQVQRIEGVVDKYIVSSRNSRSYYYRVNNGPLRFSVSSAAYEALLPGQYRLYFTARSKTLLSLEPVTPNP